MQMHRSVPQVDGTVEGGPVHMINVTAPAGTVVEPPVPEYALHLLLRTAPLLRVGFNRRPRWLAVSPGTMVLAPPDTSCEYVADAEAHVLTVAIPKPHVEDFAHDSDVRIVVRDEQAFRDPRLVHHILWLWRELATTPREPVAADQVMRTVLETLARRTGISSPRATAASASPITHSAFRDYVEGGLAEDLDVTMMAEVAG
jgi:hypothetical protein